MILVSAVGSYGVFRAAQLGCNDRVREALKLVGWLALVLAVALAAGAPRLLPVLAVTAESTRAGGLDFATAASGSASPWSLLLGYVYPSFEIPRDIRQPRREAEPLAYTGLLAIPLITLADMDAAKAIRQSSFPGRAGSQSRGFWRLAVSLRFSRFCTGYRCGVFPTAGQIHRYRRICAGFSQRIRIASASQRVNTPAPSYPRNPRLMVWYAALIFAASAIATIVLSIAEGPIRELANRAIDRFVVGGRSRFFSAEEYYDTFDVLTQRLQTSFTLASWTPVFTLVAAILSALAISAYVRGKISPRAAVATVTLVLAADLFFSLGHGIDTIPARYFEAPPETSNSPALPAGSSVLSYRGLADKWELSIGTGDRLNQTQRDLIEYLFLRQVLTPNLPMRSGLTSIDGYENLMSRRQTEILSFLGSERTPRRGFASAPDLREEEKARILGERLPVLAALGVDVVLSGTSISDSLGEPAAWIDVEFPDWAKVNQRIWIYRVPGSAGRAYLTENWQMDQPALQTSAILESLAASPPRTVFVDGDPGFPSRESAAGGRLLSTYSPNGMRSYQVEVDRTTLFVENSFITRGWKAEVDGRQFRT